MTPNEVIEKKIKIIKYLAVGIDEKVYKINKIFVDRNLDDIEKEHLIDMDKLKGEYNLLYDEDYADRHRSRHKDNYGNWELLGYLKQDGTAFHGHCFYTDLNNFIENRENSISETECKNAEEQCLQKYEKFFDSPIETETEFRKKYPELVKYQMTSL